jgi:hypothetical protein
MGRAIVGAAVVSADNDVAHYLRVPISGPKETQMTVEFNPREYSPWLDTAQAAHYVGAKAGTLKNWRHRGEGPKYSKVNARLVRYHQSDLDTFILANSFGGTFP